MSWVYAAGTAEIVKIGFTERSDPWQRLGYLRVTNPLIEIEPFGAVPATRDHERELHRLLAGERACGREWYRRGGPLVETVLSMLGPWPQPAVLRRLRWSTVEATRIERLADMSRAELARAFGMSESSYSKGLKHNSRILGARATLVAAALDALVAERTQ